MGGDGREAELAIQEDLEEVVVEFVVGNALGEAMERDAGEGAEE